MNALKQKPNLFLQDFEHWNQSERPTGAINPFWSGCSAAWWRREAERSGGGGGVLGTEKTSATETLLKAASMGKGHDGLGSTFLSQRCDQIRSRPSTLEARHRRGARLASARSGGTGRREMRGQKKEEEEEEGNEKIGIEQIEVVT